MCIISDYFPKIAVTLLDSPLLVWYNLQRVRRSAAKAVKGKYRMNTKINTSGAPAAIGPYSQASVVGGLVFTSGQIALDPENGVLAENDIRIQTHRVCQNLKAVLEAAGSSLENVVKTTCFLADMADFAAFNEVYAEYFTKKPARSCVAVKTLPKGALVEVEAIGEIN